MSKAKELIKKRASCRGCRRPLDGDDYMYGGRATHPITGETVPINYYGGFVCSQECDYRASLEMEQSMPGHGPTQTKLGYGSESHKKVIANWKDN